MPRTVHEITAEELATINAEVQSLLAERLPVSFSPEFTWPFWATALLARSAAILDSITALAQRGRVADAEVALRTLYEHVTTLCWLAIDPEAHLAQWRGGSELRWLQFDREAYRHFGRPVLEPTTAATLAGAKLKSLEQRAENVASYWPERISAFKPHVPGERDSLMSFRGVYTAIYRTASRLAHAEVDSLQANVWERPNRLLLVTTEERPSFGRAGLAPPLFAFALLVYDHHFGWPGEPRTSRIVAAMNYEPPSA